MVMGNGGDGSSSEVEVENLGDFEGGGGDEI